MSLRDKVAGAIACSGIVLAGASMYKMADLSERPKEDPIYTAPIKVEVDKITDEIFEVREELGGCLIWKSEEECYNLRQKNNALQKKFDYLVSRPEFHAVYDQQEELDKERKEEQREYHIPIVVGGALAFGGFILYPLVYRRKETEGKEKDLNEFAQNERAKRKLEERILKKLRKLKNLKKRLMKKNENI